VNTAQHQVHRVFNKYLLDATRDRKDILALQALAPLAKGFLPWSQAAMRPSGLLAVLNDIVINRRTCIVECGGGISTFFIARLLRARPGHLYSIEHDADWAALLQQNLNAEGLGEQATVIHAPLVDTPLGWNGARSAWYADEKLCGLKRDRKIDLLIVDGPPAYTKDLRYARYPAVPYFKDALAPDYTVVLDDINRRGEQEIAARWGRELGVAFNLRFIDGTIAVGRPRHSFSV
jgi:predicted O-methyltransferase YrrM